MSMDESNVVNKVAAKISVDVSPALEAFMKMSDGYQQAVQRMVQTGNDMQKALSSAPKSGGDLYFQQANGAILNLRDSIKDLNTQFKEGTISADQLLSRIQGLRTTYAGAFDPSTRVGFLNDQALRNAVVDAETQLSKLYDFQTQSEIQINSNKEASDKAYTESWNNLLNKQTDEKVQQVRFLHDAQLQSARDSYEQLLAIYEQDYSRFEADINKKIQLLKTMSTYEREAFAQDNATISGGATSSGTSRHASRGFTISPGEMAKDMLMWQAFSSVFQNVQTGIIDVGKASAGLQQVFQGDIKTQQQLNDVTNQFIDIAKEYGTSIDEVLQAGKLWGRQYSEQISEVLTGNSTMLSIVDNLKVTDANQAVESSMQALGMQVNNTNDAMTNSMRLIDSWTAVSHGMSVSTAQLTQGFERAAASAKLVGLNIDQLTSLIANGVRNTGREGTVIGNTVKSVLDNIVSESPKAVQAMKELGVSMYQTGANGQQEMRPIWNILLDLSQAFQTANSSQTKMFSDLAGGKYQFDNFVATISNLKGLQDGYNLSLHSTGETQKLAAAQMHTLAAEFQRLHDTIQQMAYNDTSGGLGEGLKGIVVGLTDLINGLQALPGWVDKIGLMTITFLAAGKAVTTLNSLVTGIMSTMKGWKGVIDNSISAVVSAAGSTAVYTANLEGGITALEGEVAALEGDTAAQEANTVSRAEATAATEAEQVANKGLAASFLTLDGAAAGVTMGLTLLIPLVIGLGEWMNSNSQATSENAQKMKELSSAYQSHKAQADSLLQTYQQLDQVTKGGTAFKDDAQQKQYFDTMQSIAGILPNVTAYVDENGRAHLQTADAIKQEIQQQQELMKLKAQDTISNFNTDFKDAQDNIAFYNQEISRLTKEIDSREIQSGHGIKHLTDSQVRDLRDQREQIMQQIDATINTVRQKYTELANSFVMQSGTELNQQSQGMLSRLIGNVDWDKVGNDATKVQSTIQDIVNTVVKAQNSAKDGKISNDAYGQSYDELAKKIPMAVNAQRDFTSSSNQATASNNSQSSSLSKLVDMVSQAADANKTLLQAQQEMSTEHKLSQSTLDALIQKYPEFINVLGQGDAAIQAWIKSQIDSNATTVAAERNKTQAVISETKERIKAMMAEIDALNALADAEMAKNQGSDTISARFIQAAGIMSSHVGDAKAQLQHALGELSYLGTSYQSVTNPGAASGGSGSKGVRGGGSSSQTYLDRFSKLSQNDDYGLQHYTQRVNATSAALDQMSNAFTKADDNLKAHATDTKAASDAIKAYNDDVKALNDHANALAGENWQLQQELNGVSAKMKGVDADFKAGKIDAQTHQQAIYDLTQEYDRLTSTLNSNTKAIQQDKDAIAQATASITSEIVSMLQTAYQDEQKIQEDALQNIYQPQIDALTKQKDAIDQVIQSLQAQWQAQDQVNKLQDLQNQLTQVMADKRFEVVGTDGKLTYTYDTAKAADLQKQIADQQTQMQHDKEIKELNDQKNALDRQIQNLKDAYDKAKQQLDDYWKYKLSQDQLKSDADNLILKNGMAGALQIVQQYSSQIISQYNAIQQAAANAGAAISSGLGGAGVPMGGATSAGASSSGKTYTLADQSGKLHTGTDYDAIVNADGGQWLNHKWVPGHYINGVWSPGMKDGGMVPLNMGVPGMDSVPALLAPGGIVVPSWDDLLNGIQHINKSSSTVLQFNGDLSFPNVKGAGDAEAFLYELTEKVGVHRV